MPVFRECRCDDRENIKCYEILGFLGKGGFANVYKARCRFCGMKVAIKKINISEVRANKMEDRVFHEVNIHSRLRNPAVLEVYVFFEDDDYVYLVLELCQQDLQHFLKEHGSPSLPEEEVRGIVHQLVEGLVYLHSNGIIHRDLSLSNILLTEDMQVKIADFGLATTMTPLEKLHQTMCGTPNFISPEVATKSSHGFEVDIWSLGCLVYTLLVGKPPFDTETVKATLTRVVMAEYKMPSHISDNAKDLIEKLLKKNPSDRILLKNILRHPFFVLANRRRGHNRYLNAPKFSEHSGDSGFGRTMSSCDHPRLRSRSEERSGIKLLLYNKERSTVSARSEPLMEPSVPSFQPKSYNAPHCKNSILAGIPLRSRIFPLDEKSSFQRIGEEDKHRSHRHRKKESDRYCEEDEEPKKLPVPPFNTRRLQPKKHRTKSLLITILNDGEVCLETLKKYGSTLGNYSNDNLDKVTEVCRISSEGLRIVLYKINPPLNVDTQPPPLPVQGVDSIYSYENLPAKHHRKYLYAARFVNLLRAKTVKVTLYTQKAKCYYMENVPHPDCEVIFYKGIKITKVGNVVKLQDGSYTTTYVEDDSPTEYEEYYTHYKECYSQCTSVDLALTNLETATSFPYFPAIIGRKPTALTDLSTEGKENSMNSVNIRPLMPSFGSCSTISTIESHTKSKKSNSLRISHPSAKWNNGPIEVIVPNIGVATQSPSGHIKIKYHDRSKATVIPQEQGGGVIYERENGSVQKYSAEAAKNKELIPADVFKKIEQLQYVIKYLAMSACKNLR